MSLEYEIERVTLTLEHPFTIARRTSETQEVVVLTLTDEAGRIGRGAAAPSRFYGETAGTVEAILPELCDLVTEAPDPFATESVERSLEAAIPRNPAARVAVSMALHDLLATRMEVSFGRLLGLGTTVSLESSFTVGIAAPDEMAARAVAGIEAGHGILKVKLGSEHDEAALAAVREAAPDARIRVDANEGWTRSGALEMIDCCSDHDVELIEQPVPAGDIAGLERVHASSSVPIIADEACVRASDVPRVAGRCDVVNLKLMKCGGIREAVRLIHTARAHHLEVMIGCMVEPSISIAAAAHLTPLVDYADLDGALLVSDDPFTGSPVRPGGIDLDADRPGLGIERA